LIRTNAKVLNLYQDHHLKDVNFFQDDAHCETRVAHFFQKLRDNG
jgi:hypothetical protein